MPAPSASSRPAGRWRRRAPGRGSPWIVSPTGAFLGWCSLNRWNPEYRSVSLGYCFDDAAWGHGYATEAARALLRVRGR
ncbi:GNAT family N-acetyltransferase [Micromonospora musae]|uniref:GNAT family N-acetyltransferase n=1 Tax=Micromonospora musae TaxID=1894970 RepID=UPI003440354B